jgi:hypothetical protein
MFALLLILLASAAYPAQPRISDSERLDILKRAQVWIPPAVPIAQANLAVNPDGDDGFAEGQTVECRFEPHGVGGSTPKFDCRLPSGRLVKVKYGAGNAEVSTEVAATRLLAAIGFPTDRMYRVAAVRCFGCPPDPFTALKCLYTRPASQCFAHLDYSRAHVFTTAVIERALEGRRIETKNVQGWGWHELASINPGAGGASRRGGCAAADGRVSRRLGQQASQSASALSGRDRRRRV